METIKLLSNIAANIVLFVYSLMFYIYVFGDDRKAIAKWNMTKLFLLKVGVISIICGSLYSAVTLSDPAIGEVVLNIGLSLLFVWAYDFHKKMFKNRG
jgi:hypothetical protein